VNLLNYDTNLHLWVIPLLPLVAQLSTSFWRRFKNGMLSAVSAVYRRFFRLSAWAVYSICRVEQLRTSKLCPSPGLRQGFLSVLRFYLDQLSMIMVLVARRRFPDPRVSVGYMAQKAGITASSPTSTCSCFFMLTLVLANNYLLML